MYVTKYISLTMNLPSLQNHEKSRMELRPIASLVEVHVPYVSTADTMLQHSVHKPVEVSFLCTTYPPPP